MNMMNDSRFLQNVLDFGQVGKDKINEETIEFLLPYMELENFTSQVRPPHLLGLSMHAAAPTDRPIPVYVWLALTGAGGQERLGGG